ncbi:MAG: aspartyl protease family protein [Burkholderiales bacterium]|nr:aspartyl protease family protein [Burkholderiales bacterium]
MNHRTIIDAEAQALLNTKRNTHAARPAMLATSRRLLLLAISLASAACQSDWPQAAPRAFSLHEPMAVTVRLPSHVPVALVLINGQGPFRMMLDTGSSTIVLPPRIAGPLNLPPGAAGSEFARSASGYTTVDYRRIRSLQLGNADFREVDAKIFDLPEKLLGPNERIDGLLGLRLFHDMLITLDYETGRLTIDPNGSLNPSDPQTVRAKLEDGKHLVFPVTIGDKQFPFILDTGTSFGFMLTNEAAQQVKYAVGPMDAGVSQTATGGMKIQVGRLAQRLMIANHVFDRPVVYTRPGEMILFTPNAEEPLFSREKSLIGGEALRHFELSIDQRNNLIRFHRAKPGAIQMRQ